VIIAIAGLLVVGSVVVAGNPVGSFNRGGSSQLGDFFAAALDPELSGEFLRLTGREAMVTLSYAVLGTAFAVVTGLVGGVLLSRRWWEPATGARPGHGWRAARVLAAVPRSVHEVVWGLLLLNVLGLDPLVAVLAIGIPFGAITAQVFSGVVDETDAGTFRALRAAGAGRIAALAYSVGPDARADLVSYAFYRFECSIRSAAILGIVGAGGLGFQLQLSFTSLRYGEVWTLLYALIALSGAADAWSGRVRRRAPASISADGIRVEHRDGRRTSITTWLVLAAGVPLAWWRVGLDPSSLWSSRSREQFNHVLGSLWPPSLRDGWGTLVAQTVDTVALSVLAMVLAFVGGLAVALVAAGAVGPRGLAGRLLRQAARGGLLVARAIPPPVWAIVVLFVLFPGPWPAALALAVYNLGVVGRLLAEVVENADDAAPAALVAGGATRLQAVAYATVPDVWGRFVALGLYRWEVTIRETVVVGVVGAGGLGRALDEELSAFAWSRVTSIVLALVTVTIAVDALSHRLRPDR
jgi:phosphonate transport system permease protein